MAFNGITVNQCRQKNFLIMFTVAACLQATLCSCILFGYSSLLVIFKKLGLYKSLCVENFQNETISTTSPQILNESCVARDQALNLPFAIGIILYAVVKIPLGKMIDVFGAKPSQYIGCCSLMLFGMSLAYVEEGKEYLLFIAFIFLSISSSLLMLCPYQVSNILFVKNKALVLSLLSGCVDGSTVIFIIFLEIYQQHVSFSGILIAYSVGGSCILMIATTFLYPTKEVLQSFIELETINNIRPQLNGDENEGDDEDNLVDTASSHVMRSQDFASNSIMSSYSMYHDAIHKSLQQVKENDRREALLASLSENLAIQISNRSYDGAHHKIHYVPNRPYGTIIEGSVGYQADSYAIASHVTTDKSESIESESLLIPINENSDEQLTPYSGHRLRQYFFSKLMIIGTYTTVILMLKIVYFIANLDKYLYKMVDTETATSYIKYFGYVQFGGIIAAPICSMLFRDNVGTERLSAHEDFVMKVKMLILPSFVIIFDLVLIDVLQLFQNIYLSVPIFILYLFGNSLVWCYVSLFFAYLFPARYYCTLYGIATGVSGVVSFVQYPLLSLESSVFKGEQFYTNLLFLGLLISTLVLPFYLIYLYRKLKMAALKTQEKAHL